MILCRLLFFMGLIVSAVSAEVVSSVKASGQDLDWRSVNRCGPNAMHAVLFIHGLRPSYNQIISGMTITDRGASVADLMQASNDNGLPLVAIKAKVEELTRFSMPAIVHYQPPGELGHYAVPLRVNPDKTFYAMEAARGTFETRSTGDLLSNWSGVVLIRKSDWMAWQYAKFLFLRLWQKPLHCLCLWNGRFEDSKRFVNK